MEKRSKARIKKLQACVAQFKTQRKEVSKGSGTFVSAAFILPVKLG